MGGNEEPTDAHARRDIRASNDSGTGLIGTSAAVTVFLVFLLFAVQLLIGLYGRSVVTATAYDGARSVAGARVDHANPTAVATAQDAATARMRQQLGDVGSRATFDWNGSDADTIVLRVRANNPRLSFPGFDRPMLTDHIDRTVHARIERLR